MFQEECQSTGNLSCCIVKPVHVHVHDTCIYTYMYLHVHSLVVTSAVGTGPSPMWQSNTKHYNFFLNIIKFVYKTNNTFIEKCIIYIYVTEFAKIRLMG